MRKRYILAWTAFAFFAATTLLQAQNAGRPFGTAGFPKIECSMSSSADQLFFRGNDYVPNQITVSIKVKNISADTARNLVVCMGIDTRFIAINASCTDTLPFLLGFDSVTVNFDMKVASERKNDGLDTIRALATTSNGASSYCEHSVWVEHEYYPFFQTICSNMFGQIVFDDLRNDYIPNPFRIGVQIKNLLDGNSDSTIIQYLGTRGVSIDTSDPVNNTSIRYLGTLAAAGATSVEYDFRAIKRNNDTTVTLCFQVQGKGGYKRKTYVDSCCIDVFIPAARQAVYDISCDVLPDSINYVQHKYTPDPFDYTATVRNIGTANGKGVKAQLILPPSVQLAPGDSITKTLDNLDTGGSVNVSWKLRPANRTVRDTVKICMRVYDIFENSALCCDSVIIDSIRSAKLDIACICPDSIKLDAARGVYDPDSFFVAVRVRNVGSDYADSVKATIIIQTPDVTGADPFFPIKRKVDYSVPASDILGVNGEFTFDWLLKALPRAVSGFITIKFKVEAQNAATAECECRIFIPKLDAPDYEPTCTTDPVDSLHFNPETGLYTPEDILVTVRITNPGGGVAKNLKAILALPPRVLLAPGETLEKAPIPKDIGPADVAVVSWRVKPLVRRDYGADMTFTVDVTAENVPGRKYTSCVVFVPALPYTLAMVIPNDPVTYFGQHVNVPIFVDDPEGKSINALDFRLDFNVDQNRNPLPKPLVQLDPSLPFIADARTLLNGWTVSVQEYSTTHLRVTATTSGGYLALDPGNPEKPLMMIGFMAVFGNAPDHNKVAVSQVLWPERNSVLDSVRINNGSIFPRITSGSLTISGDCLRPLEAGDRFVISQNRPNPFNPSTVIQYAVPVVSPVRIIVYDSYGRIVRVLVDEVVPAGSHSVTFDANGLPSGMYLYRMETPQYQQMMKMVLTR